MNDEEANTENYTPLNLVKISHWKLKETNTNI